MATITRSIVTKTGIAASALAGVVVICALVLTFLVTKDQLRESINDQLDKQAGLVSMRVKTTLDILSGNLSAMAENKLLANALADSQGRDTYLHPYLVNSIKTGGIPIDVQLSDYKGRPVVSTMDVEEQARLAVMLRSVVENSTPTVVFHDMNGRWNVVIAWPIVYANTGTTEGSLLYSFEFNSILKGIFPPNQVDSSFRIIWSRPDSAVEPAILQGNSPPAAVISLYLPVELPETFKPWTAYVEVWRDKEEYQNSIRLLLKSYFLIGLFGLFIMIPSGLFISRGVLNRLRQLESNARKVMETQSLEHRFAETGDDEIASLGRIFNRMLGALDQAQMELKSETTKELRRYSEQHKQVLALTAEGYVRVDVSRRVVLEVNDAFCRMSGRDQGSWIDSPPPNYLMKDLERADRADDVASWTDDELVIPQKDGVEHYYLGQFSLIIDEGSSKQLVAFITDITSRKMAETALKESEEKLLAMSVSSYDALVMIDSEDTVLFWSDAAERLFGYKRGEVLGRKLHPLITLPEEQAQAYRGMPHFARTGEGAVIGTVQEFMAVRKNGETFPIERSVSAFTMRGKWFAVGSVRDITERKKIDKLKKEFISTVSHELRTPLTSISGSIELILGAMAAKLPEQVLQLLTIASNNTKRLIALINDILDIEKIESGKMKFQMEVLDLAEAVKVAVQDNQAYAQSFNVRFEVRIENTQIMVRADKVRLAQVMANLLSNAVKYSPTGESVVIGMTRVNGHARVFVRDRGPGIPKDFRERIFTQFAQADSSDTRSKGGTGLGLHITQKIVEAFDGKISFFSTEGHGSEFFFDLPVLQHGGAALSMAFNQDTSGYARVLHVEDDPDVLEIVSRVLGEIASVTGVPTAAQARRLLAEQEFDLILLDLNLPDGSGLVLLSDIGVTPVIAFAAENVPEEFAGRFQAVFLKSKTDNDTLLSTVKRILQAT